jgi:hypothetical protein
MSGEESGAVGAAEGAIDGELSFPPLSDVMVLVMMGWS